MSLEQAINFHVLLFCAFAFVCAFGFTLGIMYTRWADGQPKFVAPEGYTLRRMPRPNVKQAKKVPDQDDNHGQIEGQTSLPVDPSAASATDAERA